VVKKSAARTSLKTSRNVSRSLLAKKARPKPRLPTTQLVIPTGVPALFAGTQWRDPGKIIATRRNHSAST